MKNISLRSQPGNVFACRTCKKNSSQEKPEKQKGSRRGSRDFDRDAPIEPIQTGPRFPLIGVRIARSGRDSIFELYQSDEVARSSRRRSATHGINEAGA